MFKGVILQVYSNYEKRYKVIYPESDNATYSSLMNYSDDLNKPFQRWYRYKEGFSIDLVKQLIREYCKNLNGTILDPFAGSGSTLIGASELGLKSVGFEVNPFSYFLANTKLENYDKETAMEFKNCYEDILSKSLVNKEEFSLPKLSISSKVFDDNIQHYYMGIKQLICNCATGNEYVKNLLKLGWLACLENVSSYRKAGNGLKKKKYVKPRIITITSVYENLKEQYSNMYNDIVNNRTECKKTLYNETCIDMDKHVQSESISGIIFSPPYANCFDYTEIYKLELWFGDFVGEYSDLKKLRKKSIRSHLNGDLSFGMNNIKSTEFLDNIVSEVEKKELWDKKIPNMLRLYFNDMFKVLDDCYKALESNGFCAIIVGNSAYGGVVVPTDLILAQYAESIGFTVDKIEVDRYIITSSQQYEATKENSKYLRESLICLKKGNVRMQPIVVENLPSEIEAGKTYSISQPNPNRYTHNYFKYPCKFIPEIPRWAIKKYINIEDAVIFDPFSGSGTTLLESIINNYNAYGTEIDDIAKLITKVKTTALSNCQLIEANRIFNEIMRSLVDDNIEPTIPEIKNITHWFPENNINELGKLLTLINEINDVDIRDFFRICFVSIIKGCSYADNVSPKPYVSSRIKKIPLMPIDEFTATFKKYINGMTELSSLNLVSRASIVDGDALSVNAKLSVDLIVTSPPYINAFDYGRTLRLENLWLGFLTEEELREKKKDYVGTEKVKVQQEEASLDILNYSVLLREYYEQILLVDKKRALIVKKFFDDMKSNLIEMYKILKDNGHYCIVIGNSSIRNIEVESWKVLREIALEIGYVVDTNFNYIIQNPYIRIPRNGKGGKINTDYVLVLTKEL